MQAWQAAGAGASVAASLGTLHLVGSGSVPRAEPLPDPLSWGLRDPSWGSVRAASSCCGSWSRAGGARGPDRPLRLVSSPLLWLRSPFLSHTSLALWSGGRGAPVEKVVQAQLGIQRPRAPWWSGTAECWAEWVARLTSGSARGSADGSWGHDAVHATHGPCRQRIWWPGAFSARGGADQLGAGQEQGQRGLS